MWKQLNHWGNSIAKLLGERTGFGVSPSAENIADLFNYTRITSLLPYEAYDPETQIYLNKQSSGFILEAQPLTSASEEVVDILASILTDTVPIDVDLQFLLWASGKIGAILRSFERERSGQNEIFSWLARQRTEFLQSGAHTSLIANESFNVRDFRLLIVVSLGHKRGENLRTRLVELRQDIVSSLQSIALPTRNLVVTEFLSLMSDWLNPSLSVDATQKNWNEYDALALQMSDAEYSLRVLPDKLVFTSAGDGKPNFEARALTVADLPETMTQWKMNDSIGQLFNATLQIPGPFLLSFNVRVLDHEQSQLNIQYKYVEREKTAKSPLAKFRPLIDREYENFSLVRQRLAEGDRLVKTFYQVIIFAPQEQAASVERKVRDLYRANGWRLRKELYVQFQSYLAALPMMMSEGMYEDLRLMGRLRTLTAFSAINLAPLQGEWKGTATPSLLLLGRRGQLATWNPFDNQEGNFNVAIAAASGKGKSMFTQEYITCLVGSGGRVWVIDVGRSYEKTCKLLGGEFIEFLPELNLSLNPFTFIRDFSASLVMLKPLLAAMVHPHSNASDEEISFLEKALKAAWQLKYNAASITTVAEWLAVQDSAVCQNLAHLLYTYTKDGMYGRYFEGPSNINLNNSLVVLELQELKAKKDLQKIMLLVLMYQISEAMYVGKRDQIKSCIIDEAWDLLSGDNDGAAKFIETGYRTARRYRANFVTITQSLNDYFKNHTSMAAFENSDYNLILGQKAEALDQLKKQGHLPMDAFAERLFKSLRKTDDYSECIIKGPSGLSVHRIIFDPYARILYSSKGEDYEAVKTRVAQGITLREAIAQVARSNL